MVAGSSASARSVEPLNIAGTALEHWIEGARPKTLPAAVVPVAVGTGIAFGDGQAVGGRALLAAVVALALQIATNYANDYSDGVRGTDDVRVGPLRLVASGTARPRAVKGAALVWFGVAAVCGVVLALSTSLWLVAIGALAIAAGWLYTGGPSPYGYMGLGEVFVFVFFGLVATVGTVYVQTETIGRIEWVAAVAVGVLAVALLITNNLRDIPGDIESGKRTLAVRLGDERTRRFYVLAIAAAFVAVVVSAIDRPWALVGLAAVPLAVPPIRVVLGGAKGRDLIAVLAGTSRLQLAFGVCYSIGLAI
ncbi:MAG: 1,4-dihydroxy-2-naphthoate polyprenyltransferase [Actinomycetia bacterium]|nr:1,4-dihydroxy-2-naphthoate polyprenyltransferase [Actinomycetes bacterium]MCP4957653.1 1,4-dihydroxy-2-naphthoate polyprenyltransferase [Actinomycetes bacterium]